MGRNRGFTLIELMVVIAIIAIIAAIAIPGLLQSSRAASERNSSTSLKTVISAEADFRSNDRDGNRVNDFWTYNLAGLYTASSAVVAGATLGSANDPPVKLIELGLAAADASGGTNSGAEELPLTTYAVQGVKAGYWYQALLTDLSSATPEAYRQDTDGAGTYGSVHNTMRFGFSAWPDSLGQGRFAYIVNETNVIYRRALTASVRPGTAIPPGTTTLADLQNWPTDSSIKSSWGKMD